MNTFEDYLRRGAEIMGIELQYDAIQRIEIHRNLLLKWASKVNLTTVLEPKDMAERLYLDSAFLMKSMFKADDIHDIGSGAGFPGLVLKTMNPGMEITLTEARRKKVSFLKNVAREMGLADKLTIKWSRLGWEKEEGTRWKEVVSRATFPPSLWIKKGKTLLCDRGRLWVMAGQPHGDGDESLNWETEAEKNNLSFEQVFEYKLPFCGKKRWLVSFRRSI